MPGDVEVDFGVIVSRHGSPWSCVWCLSTRRERQA
jgi:hypothetical protein